MGITDVSIGKGTALLVCATFFFQYLTFNQNTLNCICIIFGCNRLNINNLMSLFRIALSHLVLKALCR